MEREVDSGVLIIVRLRYAALIAATGCDSQGRRTCFLTGRSQAPAVTYYPELTGD